VKTVAIEQFTLDSCVREAQDDCVLVTRAGSPVAIVVELADFDEEQIQLGLSDEFWKMISERRWEPAITRAELERRLDAGEPKQTE
jgi:PHD/YefM family antitoxin component YafN of YafNO toxin-antitoxin module